MRQVRETLARRREELVDRWRRQLCAAAESGFALDEETAVVLPELLEAVDRALERRFRARPAGLGHASGMARRAAMQGSLLGDFLFDAVLEELPSLSIPEQRALSEALSHAASEVLVRMAVQREERRQRRRTARLTRLAHDLRNSATAARLAFDLLRKRGSIDDLRAARLLDASLAQLRDCIDDTLLDEALAPGELRLSELKLLSLLDDARFAAAEWGTADKKVKVLLDQPRPALRVNADPRLVRPALNGLLRAAVQLARPGATIRVGAAARGGQATVAVELDVCRRLAGGRLPDLAALALARKAMKAHGGSLGRAARKSAAARSFSRFRTFRRTETGIRVAPCVKPAHSFSTVRPGEWGVDKSSQIIAIFNTSPEVLELVRESLQQAGFQAVIAHIDDLKRGRLDMIQFVEEHKPDVIVYDVAPPYDTNWTFLRLMRNSKVMQGRAFVVTTTNKRALEELIGPNDAVELLCKPYDLQQIVDACAAAFEKQVTAKATVA